MCDCGIQALKMLCRHFSISFEACNFRANVYDRCYGFMNGLHAEGRAEVTCWPHIKGATADRRSCAQIACVIAACAIWQGSS